MLIGLRSDKDDLKRLQYAFEAMDANKDGTLSKDEFEQAATLVQTFRFKDKEDRRWTEVFSKIDLDGDGRLDFHEFIAGAVDHQKMLTKKNLQYMFKLFDVNNDGVIELDEFKNTLPTQYRPTVKEDPMNHKKKMNAQNSDNSNSPNFMPSAEEILKHQKADDEKWKEIIAQIDSNGDGRVSFGEFEQAVEKFIQADLI